MNLSNSSGITNTINYMMDAENRTNSRILATLQSSREISLVPCPSRGLHRTPGNLRLSEPLPLSTCDSSQSKNSGTSCGKNKLSRNNSLETFIQNGMANLKLTKRPQIEKIRASLYKKCSESRRRLSATQRNSFLYAAPHSNIAAMRSSLTSSSGASRTAGYDDKELSFSARCPQSIRRSLMSFSSSMTPSMRCLESCTSIDIDELDIDEQRKQLEFFQNLVQGVDDKGEEFYGDEEELLMSGGVAPTETLQTGDICSNKEITALQQGSNPCVEDNNKRGDGDYDEEQEVEDVLIEVAPGVRLSLKTPEESWNAVLSGRITVTTCTACGCELTCADDAEVVVCTDCWVFSPVDQCTTQQHQQTPTESLLLSGPPRYRGGQRSMGSIDVGIKAEEIFKWLEAQEMEYHL